jgi:type 1 glutamine amidotransferase
VVLRTVADVPSRELVFVSQVAPYRDGPAGVHGVLEQATTAVAQLAGMHELEAVPVVDVTTLDPTRLARAGALVLFTIGETPWSAAQRSVILERVRAGELAVLGIHSATDACDGWDDYGRLLGARFDGHPWTQTVELEVPERHAATDHLGATWRWHDEVYQFRDLRPDARVLLRVPVEQLDLAVPGACPPSFGYPVAWCHAEGRGRVFTTALGHFPTAWESPAYLRHLHGGLQWALAGDDGDEGGDAGDGAGGGHDG